MDTGKFLKKKAFYTIKKTLFVVENLHRSSPARGSADITEFSRLVLKVDRTLLTVV